MKNSIPLAVSTILLAASSLSAATHYVSLESTNPTPPYTNWQNAARVIQDAVDVAGAGDQVVVTNGIYAEGGRAVVGTLTNRVAVGKPLVLSSVNGPQATVIDGGSAVGCVYLTNGATLSGFTLSNGVADNGGGVFCESTNAVLSNCVLTANSAYSYGGGCYYGTLNGCTLTGNSAYAQPSLPSTGGAAYHCVLNNCLLSGNSAQLGGGVAYSTLNNCTLTSNNSGGAYENGGGAVDSLLYNCTLSGNWAWFGGGASGGTLNNCTLAGNSAYEGGGAYSSGLSNCVLASNSAIQGGGGAFGCSLISCTVTDNTSTIDGGGAFHSYLNVCTVAGNSAGVNGGGTAGDATLINCTLTGNSAYEGGGAEYSALYGCSLSGNSAYQGGGVYSATLFNCTLTGNFATGFAGGACESKLYNCIVYFNQASHGVDVDNSVSCTLNSCCTTPLPTSGTGNIVLDPQLASAIHLSANSPCRGAGSGASGSDIDGEAWGVPPSIGCDEYHPGAVTGPLTVNLAIAFTNVAVGYPVSLVADIQGRTSASTWDFGDGVIATNQPYTSYAWTTTGDYSVVLRAYNESYPAGVTATVIVHVSMHPAHYVVDGNSHPEPPYLSWDTAAATIQQAVDAAAPGAEVFVTNGIYALGGRATRGTVTNRVAVDKPLTVRSVNGPQLTLIDGSSTVRCVYLTNGATLSGFTVTNGSGGVYCEASGTVSNCVIVGNAGGGASGGRLYNCTLTSNSAVEGGGAYGGTLYNCTLIGNSSSYGGGAYSSTLYNCSVTGNWAVSSGGGVGFCSNYNCIVYFNTAPEGANYDSESILDNCCTTPLPPGGTGNVALDPQLASASHLSASSPCRGAGNTAYASGADIDGEAWGVPPSIGCDEYHVGTVTGPLSVAILVPYTNLTVGYMLGLTAAIEGRTAASVWDFGDGLVVSNWPYATHAWTTAGDYTVALWAFNESHPDGLTATVTVHVTPTVYYVSAANPNPVAPYTNWATAAQTIQDAVDAAVIPGAVVLVESGQYSSGGRAVGNSSLVNRVAVTKPLAVRSVNGPQSTTILGYQLPTIINGPGAIRCVYLTNGASLSGFTLSRGATLTNGNSTLDYSGGGVCCDSTNALITNCVLTGNSADYDGGGAYSGTLNDCTLAGNWTPRGGGGACASTLNTCAVSGNSADSGGGARSGILNDCLVTDNSASGFDGYGGGVEYCTLNNSAVARNDAYWGGGGAAWCTLYHCSLSGNSTGFYGEAYGGGAAWCTLYNCTLTGNSTHGLGGGLGGGASGCTLYDCVLTGNSASQGGGVSGGTLYNCTLTGNSAYYGGGGASADCCRNPSTLYNCIAYFNTSTIGTNYDTNSILNNCCTTPLPTNGVGNIIDAPLFVDYANGNLRLQSNSPCINAGNNAYVTAATDLDGNPRIVGGTVDIGAYECQLPALLDFYNWLQDYNLSTSASSVYADSDGDGMNNWQEWACGTDPTNRLSALRLLSPSITSTSATVSWQSVAGVNYFLERGGSLAAPFTLLATNIIGQAGTTSYADTNATDAGPLFYRVGVKCP